VRGTVTEKRSPVSGTADGLTSVDGITSRLDRLLDRVRTDDEARREFLGLLESLGANDPGTAAAYRRKLTAQLY
jgi:putative thioredoxin